MSRFFFLPKILFYGLFFFNIYLFFDDFSLIKVLVPLITLVLLFFFRKSSVLYQETIRNDGEIFLSPVHGFVESIRFSVHSIEDDLIFHEIKISLKFWQQKGFYLPTAGEISAFKKESSSNNNLGNTDLTLISKNGNRCILKFFNSLGGLPPMIWVKSGDRGRGGACFGYYPFGGTLIIYLPAKSDILVFEKEKLFPGQSVIAAIKN
jgi:hypothetical protein